MLTALIILVATLLAFPLVAGYIVHIERKVLADFQVRLGPMRVGPYGLMQPLADAVKLLLKEDIRPASADRWIFLAAPVVSVFTALSCFAVLPFSRQAVAADVNVGLLVITAMASVGILGIILGGWASNSHYPLLGALRSAAQALVAGNKRLACTALAAYSVTLRLLPAPLLAPALRPGLLADATRIRAVIPC